MNDNAKDGRFQDDMMDRIAMDELDAICRERGWRLVRLDILCKYCIRIDSVLKTVFVSSNVSCKALTACANYIATMQ